MSTLLSITDHSERARYERNQSGRIQGYGECAHCHDTWDWKKAHNIEFTPDGIAMFPCCAECWPTLSLEQRLGYATSLLRAWNAQCTTPEDWRERLVEAVRSERL